MPGFLQPGAGIEETDRMTSSFIQAVLPAPVIVPVLYSVLVREKSSQ